MGILIAGIALLINSGNEEEEVRLQVVPEVAGLQTADLINQFSDFWVLEEALTREDGTQNGEILRTIPDAGVELAEGKVLTYFVSLGPELRTMPLGLTGLTIDEAESILLESSLRLGATSEVPDEKVAIGLVIGPATSVTELPTGSEVDIEISSFQIIFKSTSASSRSSELSVGGVASGLMEPSSTLSIFSSCCTISFWESIFALSSWVCLRFTSSFSF